jgi:glycosyltransferase involved in cell wall biosynthesis
VSIRRPLISVIIPHLNQPQDLEACLSSLDVQSLERTLFEVIVVDNGSISVPDSVVANHPGTRLLRELQPGPGPARNAGTQAAIGDIFAFIDADCRADPEWLRSAFQALCLAAEKTILGGDVRIWREHSKAYTAIGAYEGVFAYRFKLYIEQHGFCGTGNLVVHREHFYKIGQFSGINFAEDIEWGQRARAAGFSFCYVPEMIVFHPPRRSLRELYVKWDRHTQHFFNMAQDRRWWRVRWMVRAVAVLASPILDFAKVLSSDRIQGGSTRLKAISVLLTIRAYRAYKMLSLLRTRNTVIWNRGVGA